MYCFLWPFFNLCHSNYWIIWILQNNMQRVGATPLGTAQSLTDLSHKLFWCIGIIASVLSNLFVFPLQCCTLYFACQQLTNVTHHQLSRCPLALPGRKLKNLLSIRQMGFLFSHFIPTCVWKLWHDTLFPHEHQAPFHLGLFTLSLERERFPWPAPSHSLPLPWHGSCGQIYRRLT